MLFYLPVVFSSVSGLQACVRPLGGRHSVFSITPPPAPKGCRRPAPVIHQLQTQAEISRGTAQLAEEQTRRPTALIDQPLCL